MPTQNFLSLKLTPSRHATRKRTSSLSEVARDLGVGLSTLVRWIGRSRGQAMDAPPVSTPTEDIAAALQTVVGRMKSYGREHEILNRAATFFAKEGSR